MARKWEIGYYGPANASVRMDGEELSVMGLELKLNAGQIPELNLRPFPRNMKVELVDALVEIVPSGVYVLYEHHGRDVWVDASLQGLHRAYCLCYRCARFKHNCPKAERLYQLCVEEDMTTPVWECPLFVEDNKEGA